MARMPQSEIDEISEAFNEAWSDYFGMDMYLVPFDKDSTSPHPVYKESKEKRYREDLKKLFHGTFRQLPIEEVGEVGGNRNRQFAEITFVTKQLRDQGVLEVDQRDIIDVMTREGYKLRFNIIAAQPKVQLVDSFLFTKIRVVREL